MQTQQKNNSLQEVLLRGVNLIADTVGITLGAKGQLVGLARRFGTQHLTKDGVTVAKEVYSNDKLENFAINVVREASQKTAEEAGDGTTTALVLTQALYREGLKVDKDNHVELIRELQEVSRQAVSYIEKNAKKVKQSDIKTLTQIATISANNDEVIGKMIAEVISKVGPKGVITVEPSNTLGMQTEFVEGMRLDTGFISQYFINQPKPECLLENPYVLVTSRKLTAFNELATLIEPLMEKEGAVSLVIIAEDVDGEALSNLVLNNNNPQIPFKTCVVRIPGAGENKEEFLKDICSVTGSILVDDKFVNELRPEQLGRLKRFKATRERSLLVAHADRKKQIKGRVELLKLELEDLKSDYDREKMNERIANLASGVAIVKIGASTEVETTEIRDRLDDAIRATQSVLEEGFLPGGGVAYLKILGNLDVRSKELYQEYFQAPIKKILLNAGYEESEVSELIRSYKMEIDPVGSNVLTNEDSVNVIEQGIIDPAKVVRQTIQNSVSIVSQLLQTKAVIVNREEEVKSER